MGITIDQAAAIQIAIDRLRLQRLAAYQQEAHPLYFLWQRGEATETEWKAKIDEINARYPYPEGE